MEPWILLHDFTVFFLLSYENLQDGRAIKFNKKEAVSKKANTFSQISETHIHTPSQLCTSLNAEVHFMCTSTVSEWLRLLPLLGILALLGYLTIRPFLPKKKKQRDSLINLKIQKENPKVVNEIDIEDLNSANVCYCRCWRSKTVSWPLSFDLRI